jgi:flagellar FliL protein
MADKKAPEPEENDGAEGEVPLEDDGGKSAKTKKILMIAVPILLLVGGGAGAYFTGMLDKLLGKEPAVAEHAEGGDAAKEGGHGEAKEGEEGAAHGPEVAFLKLPDLIVNLSGEGQPRYLRLSIQLELANDADLKAVEKVMPRVVDQFQTYLRELRVQDLRGSKGMYRLQMELLSRVNAAAAPTEVKDVLFQEILIQ